MFIFEEFRLKNIAGVINVKEYNDSSFLAVYDKKMLWRANLYIAEEKDDWNDLHPWIVGNEWNRVLSEVDYDAFAENKLITSLPVGDGGQVIKIPDYSAIRTGGEDEGKVTYDYPEGDYKGFDSPFDFTYKMLRQRENINQYYSNGDLADPVSFVSGDPVALSALQNWSKTIAPSDAWINYRGKPSVDYEPYVPGLGLYWHLPEHANLFQDLKGKFDEYDAQNPNALSAGVDCVGFAQRAASYNEANYTWKKIAGNITEGATSDYRDSSYPATDNAIINFAKKDRTEYILENEAEKEIISNLDKLVPGDIVYYGSSHIMMIQDITFNGSGRRVKVEDINIAESTSGNYGPDGGGIIYYTNIDRNIEHLSFWEKPWVIGRLK